MTQGFFLSQIERLKSRFGAKQFDPEMTKVLAKEVYSVADEFFRQTVDTWIGNRKTINPPLLVDFREARLAFERQNLNREASQAARTFDVGMKESLRREFRVDSIKDAFELAKLKIRLGGANDKGSGVK